MSQSISTPFAASVGLGLAASSYFFLGNMGMATCGVIKMTTDPKLRADLDINADRAVSLWACMYKSGALQFAPTALVSGASLLSASYFARRSPLINAATQSHAAFVSRLYLVAAGFAVSVLPFTVLVMMPNIKLLLRTLDRIRAARNSKPGEAVAVLQGTDADENLARIHVWKRQNLVRIGLSAVAWTLAVAGTILA